MKKNSFKGKKWKICHFLCCNFIFEDYFLIGCVPFKILFSCSSVQTISNNNELMKLCLL